MIDGLAIIRLSSGGWSCSSPYYIADGVAIIRLGSGGCVWEIDCLLSVHGCNLALSDEGWTSPF